MTVKGYTQATFKENVINCSMKKLIILKIIKNMTGFVNMLMKQYIGMNCRAI